ncbi:MAG: DUF1489 family protein [Hyphomicrobiaceae bacterium]
MTIHLVKLCVGAQSVEDLEAWQESRLAERKRKGQKSKLFHTTHQTPKREVELLAGGSLYWVIKGVITVRQKLLALEQGQKDNGAKCCLLVLDPELVLVRPVPRRAFQGWRYLADEDAPEDITGLRAKGTKDMPLKMRRELAELGLL